jgi:hypothetical protein
LNGWLACLDAGLDASLVMAWMAWLLSLDTGLEGLD